MPAAAAGLAVAPHVSPELSVTVAAAVSNSVFVEYIPQMEPILKRPVLMRDGFAIPLETPGHGIEFDPRELERLTVRQVIKRTPRSERVIERGRRGSARTEAIMRKIVAVTGASAGRRPRRRARLRQRGLRYRTDRARRRRPRGRAARGRGGWRTRARAADRCRRRGRGRAAAERIERELGPIDVWVNNAMVSVFSPVKELTVERRRTRHGGHVSRRRVRHARRAEADAAARPRRDRAGRFGARVPRHSASGRVLRREARDPGLHRIAALRAAPRSQPRARHDGAAAGDEYSAVRLGEEPAAARAAAGSADLPAGSGGRRDRLGGHAAATRDQRRRFRLPSRSGATSSPRASPTGTSHAPATTRSRPMCSPIQIGRTICGSRCPAITARMAAFRRGAPTTACKPGRMSGCRMC